MPPNMAFSSTTCIHPFLYNPKALFTVYQPLPITAPVAESG